MADGRKIGAAPSGDHLRAFASQAAMVLGWVLPIAALLCSPEASRSNSYLLYGSQLLLFLHAWNRTGSLASLLSPAALVIIYVDASFMLGNYAFSRGLVLHPGNLDGFKQWTHLHLSNAFILLMNVLLFHVDARFRKRAARLPDPPRFAVPASWQAAMAAVAISFLAVFSVFRLDVAFLGGSGNMAAVPKSVAILALIAIMAHRGSAWRFPAYAAILLAFASFSYSNKREAIFLVFPILLLEAAIYRRPLRIRTYFAGALLGAFLSALIIAMSVMRGYGGFEPDAGLFSLAPQVISYLRLEDFLPYFFNNIETNYTYFHSMQAMEYIFEDPGRLAYGSTVIKFLFAAIPSSMLPGKPHSFIDLYTTLHDPAFRAVGGSWPPNVMAEMFWNFHALGLVALPALFWGLSAAHHRLLALIRSGGILAHPWLLYAYMQILTFARGSGLDMFFIYVLFGASFGFLYLFLVQSASVRGASGGGSVRRKPEGLEAVE